MGSLRAWRPLLLHTVRTLVLRPLPSLPGIACVPRRAKGSDCPERRSRIKSLSAACEEGINSQINMELTANYVYLSMSYYFDRDDVALKNFSRYYKEQADEEQEHAEKLMNFLNRRGGRIVLKDIKTPGDEWGNGLDSMEKALQLEKDVNKSLLELHKLATEQNDPNLCGFLESYYLEEQIKAIKKFGNHITNLKRLGAPDSGLGEYLFDKHTLGQEEKE